MISVKIGVIGGVAAGKVRESITVGFNSTELEWVCEYEKPTAPVIYSAGFQRVIARPGLAEFDKYKLMILEREGGVKTLLCSWGYLWRRIESSTESVLG